MVIYYREENGDFLAIDTGSNDYYRALGRDDFEGRATAIAGQVGPVCTTAISREFLRQQCRRVPRSAVPPGWVKAIGYHEPPAHGRAVPLDAMPTWTPSIITEDEL